MSWEVDQIGRNLIWAEAGRFLGIVVLPMLWWVGEKIVKRHRRRKMFQGEDWHEL
jgi:di/tricarboxylate transporter